MSDDFQKFNPYHDPHTGRFTTAQGAGGIAAAQNFYGVKVEQGKFYDIRLATKGGYRDPSSGTLVGDTTTGMKLRGRIEYISKPNKDGVSFARVVGTHALGSWSPTKVKRPKFFIDTSQVLEAKEITPERAKIDEAVAVAARASGATALAAGAMQSPQLANAMRLYAKKKYGTTRQRLFFFESMQHIAGRNSKIARHLFRTEEGPAPTSHPDPPGGATPTGPASPKGPTPPPKGGPTTPKEPQATSFIERLRNSTIERFDDANTLLNEKFTFNDVPDSDLIEPIGGKPTSGPEGGVFANRGKGSVSADDLYESASARAQDDPLFAEAWEWAPDTVKRAKALTDDDMPDDQVPPEFRDLPRNKPIRPYHYALQTDEGMFEMPSITVRTVRKDQMFHESRERAEVDPAAYNLYQRLKIYRTARRFAYDKYKDGWEAANPGGRFSDDAAHMVYQWGLQNGDPEIYAEVLPRHPPLALLKVQASYTPTKSSTYYRSRADRFAEHLARDVHGDNVPDTFDVEDHLYFDPDNPADVITGFDFYDRYWADPVQSDYPSIKRLRQDGHI